MKYNLFIGRWSPFHLGHKTIIDSFLLNGKPVCIAIRDSEEKYPLWLRYRMISVVYQDEILTGMVKIITIPDIEMVAIGRGVGYSLVEVPEDVKVISGTKIRAGASMEVHPEVKKIIEKFEKFENNKI